MAVSPLSTLRSISPYRSQAQSIQQQRQRDFRALANALNSNDLSGAQAAFAALQKDLSGAAGGSGSEPSSKAAQSVAAAFQDLGRALQSGSLAGAKTSFAQLQRDLQAQRGGASRSSSTDHGGTDNDGDHDGSSINAQA